MDFLRAQAEGGERDVHHLFSGDSADIRLRRFEVFDPRDMLADDFAGSRARNIHSDVTAADHDYFLPDGELVAQVDVEQEVDAFINAIKIDAGDGEITAAMRTDGEQNRIEAVMPQAGDGEIASSGMIQFQCDIAGGENLANLGFDDIARQPIFGNAEIKHSSGDGSGFKNCDCIAHQRQVMGGREPNRPPSDHCDLERKFVLNASGVNVDGILRFRAMAFGEKTFESPDGDGAIDFSAAARRLAGMGAYAPTDAGQRIRVASQLISFFEAAFRDESYISTRIGVRRARHHAREVGVQPILVDSLVSIALEHG